MENYISQKKSTEELLLIVGWTNIVRREFFFNENDKAFEKTLNSYGDFNLENKELQNLVKILTQFKKDISTDTSKQINQAIDLAKADISKEAKKHTYLLSESLEFKFGVIIDNIQANTEILKEVRSELKGHNQRITTLESIAHVHPL